MLEQWLLDILVCPVTKKPLKLADKDTLAKINQTIQQGKIKNLGQKFISESLSAALIREDNEVIYPVKDNIPLLLEAEGIEYRQFQ